MTVEPGLSVIDTCTSGSVYVNTDTHEMLFEAGFTGNAQAFFESAFRKFDSACMTMLYCA